jgi:transcriptional regulator with XRE-family HTH domain
VDNYQRPNKHPSENIDPMLMWIWLEMQRQRVTQAAMTERTGYSGTSIRNWFQGRSSPDYSGVRAMVRALGHDLFAEPDNG